jgi:hypothetical protein
MRRRRQLHYVLDISLARQFENSCGGPFDSNSASGLFRCRDLGSVLVTWQITSTDAPAGPQISMGPARFPSSALCLKW